MVDVTWLHMPKPSLRLILADAFFFAINLFVAIAWITATLMAVAIVVAIIAAPFIGAFIFISKFVSFCTP